MRRDMVQIFIHWPAGPLPVRTVRPILNIQSQMQVIEPAILGRFGAELRHGLFSGDEVTSPVTTPWLPASDDAA
jgi:hypothetical protein